jgi:hypothetical protein
VVRVITFRRILKGGIPIAIMGAILGGVMSEMQFMNHIPVDRFDLGAVSRFENFALYTGIGEGILFGILGLLVFLALYPCFQYPASSWLGGWVGVVSGAFTCLSTSLILNAVASRFGFLPSVASVLFSNTLIAVAIGVVMGLVAGYLMADAGARNLR